MSQSGVSILNVFVASPSGLDAERAIISDVAESLNATLGERLDVLIRVKKWEQLLGRAGRAQGQINGLLDDCDLFLGVIFRTWGSPTGDGHDSGFAEEYEVAFSSWQRTKSPEIALFFRLVDTASLNDPGAQLEKVIAFRNRVRDNFESMYNPYATEDEFRYKVARLLIDEMHRIGTIGATGRGYSPQRSAAEAAVADLASAPHRAQLSDVFSGFAALVSGDDARGRLDSDRLGLVARAFSRDVEDLPVHLANRLFLRRDELELITAEAELWFDAFLKDVGQSKSRSQRVLPFLGLIGSGQRLRQELDAEAERLIGHDDANVRAGFLRILTTERYRPTALWPIPNNKVATTPAAAERWRTVLDKNEREVVAYLTEVGTRTDRMFLRQLETVGGEPSREYVAAISDLLNKNPSARRIAKANPEYLALPGVKRRFEAPLWASVEVEDLEKILVGGKLDTASRLAIVRFLIATNSFTDGFISRLVRESDTWSSTWTSLVEQQLFDQSLPDPVLMRVLTLLSEIDDKKTARRFVARLARLNSVMSGLVEGQEIGDGTKAVSRETVEFLLTASATPENDDVAARILANRFPQKDRYIELLCVAGAENSTLEFVDSEFVRTAVEYVASAPERASGATRRRALDWARRDNKWSRGRIGKVLLRLGSDADVPRMIAESRLDWGPERSDALSDALHKATAVRLNSLLGDEDEAVAVAALGELRRRGRPATTKRLLGLLYDPRPEVRIEALGQVADDFTHEQLADLLNTYAKARETYYYNVMCELDRLVSGLSDGLETTV